MMHGFGEMLWPDGTKYIGQFENNKREGVGRMLWQNSQKWQQYYGEWHKGKQDGVGVLQLNDGTKFSGVFKGGGLDSWL